MNINSYLKLLNTKFKDAFIQVEDKEKLVTKKTKEMNYKKEIIHYLDQIEIDYNIFDLEEIISLNVVHHYDTYYFWGEWLLSNKELFKDEVLLLAEQWHILFPYIAMIVPDTNIVAEINNKPICKVVSYIKNKFNIKNLEIKTSKDYFGDEKYPLVLYLFNYTSFYDMSFAMYFDELKSQFRYYEEACNPYAKKATQYLKHSGLLLSIFPSTQNAIYLSFLKTLYKHKCYVEKDMCEEILSNQCIYNLIYATRQTRPKSQDFIGWRLSKVHPIDDTYYGFEADLKAYKEANQVIYGFYTMNNQLMDHTYALIRNRKSDEEFYIKHKGLEENDCFLKRYSVTQFQIEMGNIEDKEMEYIHDRHKTYRLRKF